ncbi:MAG: hypothetical protein V1872_01820 [bacterium]
MIKNFLRHKNPIVIFIIVIFTIFISSCQKHTPKTYFLHQEYKNQTTPIKKVAVLPFANKTRKIDAGLITTYIFISELHNKTEFEVANLGDVNEVLVDNLIRVKDTIDFKTAKILGEKLGVEAIFIGEVLRFEEHQNEDKETIPELCVCVHLFHIKSGKTLWMSQHEHSGDDYKVIFDIGQEVSSVRLTQNLFSEMLKTLNNETRKGKR